MRVSKAAAMKAMDAYAIEVLGVPSDLLMERAAHEVTAVACRLLPDGGTVCIFCGTGNNGGDGIAAARFLRQRGYQVNCFLIGDRSRMTADAALMEKRLLEAGGDLVPFALASAREAMRSADLAIDAMFGIGLHSALRGDAADAARLMNEAPAKTIACDIPSGVLADTGEVPGDAVRADVTVTFSQSKPGLYCPPGMLYAGEVLPVDIGVPMAAQDTQPYVATLTDAALCDALLPRRQRDAHKGDFGKILLLCGSRGMTGAAAMAAKAALRTGAGLVYLGVPACVYPIVAAKLDEAVVFPLPDTGSGGFSMEACTEIEERLAMCDACLIGPGIGRDPETEAVVRRLLHTGTKPLILDADGINAISTHIDEVQAAACPVIVTPHDGEFARLGGDLSGNRIEAAKQLATSLGCIVLRKGYRTIVTDGTRTYLNTTGNPGMATGGSGDVLSGVILSLLGQKVPPLEAAALGAWLHGAAGDLCAQEIGEYGMLPGDLIAALPRLLK